MEETIKATKLLHLPTFLKGASRVVDLYGYLDVYHYEDDPDSNALKKDWSNVGKDISLSTQQYAK